MIRLVDEIRPRAVMIENVRGILHPIFEMFREEIAAPMRKLGYEPGWKLMNASDFGVPQLRPRAIFVAVRKEYSEHFAWPAKLAKQPDSVGVALADLMSANGWKFGAKPWSEGANQIAPTLVGGVS